MRLAITALLLFSCTIAAYCQSNPGNKLSESEAALLDTLLFTQRNNFEFKEKQVAFVTGSSASQLITKSQFFESLHKNSSTGKQIPLRMVVLTVDEKSNSNGYDVIIFSWSKVVITNREKKKVLQQLAQGSKRKA